MYITVYNQTKLPTIQTTPNNLVETSLRSVLENGCMVIGGNQFNINDLEELRIAASRLGIHCYHYTFSSSKN